MLAAVVLVVTGGEALYADMGHFGRRPIRLAWFSVVLPALVLNYFGQGALLLRDPGAVSNPFYGLVPSWALYPMIVIATVGGGGRVPGPDLRCLLPDPAGGAARLLAPGDDRPHLRAGEGPDLHPRGELDHAGGVRRAWCSAFRNASNLAGTYGVAVSGTMTITTILFCAVARERWHWPVLKVLSLGGLLLTVDLAFFAANLDKIPHGGWFPLAVAAIVFTLMSTWKRGRDPALPDHGRQRAPARPVPRGRRQAHRYPGARDGRVHDLPGRRRARRCSSTTSSTTRCCTSRSSSCRCVTEEIPYVEEEDRLEFKSLGQKFYQVGLRYGFMESPDVPDALRKLQAHGIAVKPLETTYYLGHETLIATTDRTAARGPGVQDVPLPKLAMWRKKLFIIMSRNAQSASMFFNLPPNRVVEMGAQIQF